MAGEREHTTISIQRQTRNRLDQLRARGQSYNGFLQALMDRYAAEDSS